MKWEDANTNISAIGKFLGPPLLGFIASSDTPTSYESTSCLYVLASYAKNATTKPVIVSPANPVNAAALYRVLASLLRLGTTDVARILACGLRASEDRFNCSSKVGLDEDKNGEAFCPCVSDRKDLEPWRTRVLEQSSRRTRCLSILVLNAKV